MSRELAHFYAAKTVALLMCEPMTARELRDALECDRATMPRIIESLVRTGVIYAHSWPRVRQGPIVAKWSLNTKPFENKDVERPIPDYVLKKMRQDANKANPVVKVKKEPPKRIRKYVRVEKIEGDPLPVRRQADFTIPVGIPNSIFDVR